MVVMFRRGASGAILGKVGAGTLKTDRLMRLEAVRRMLSCTSG